MTRPTAEQLLRMKSLPYGSVSYITDSSLEAETEEVIRASTSALWDPAAHDKFMAAYLAWITSTRLNVFQGLEGFPHRAFTNGTTEAFDKFYLRNHSRRMRMFRGEYMYHFTTGDSYFGGVTFLEDESLRAGDAVVMSLPFADTGGLHPGHADILRKCDQIGVPVLIDCSYFGVCGGLVFDLDHPCIEEVAFSLSKAFPIPHLRVGMRLSRFDSDPLLVYNSNRYVNRLGAAVGAELMRRYGPDHAYETYRATQESFCEQLGVEASECVFFGIDRQDRYPEYNRGGATNRLCFSKFLRSGRLV